MMELGATVCTPRNPKCGECPVASTCAARALELEEEANVTAGKEPFRVTDLPEKDKKADKREETVSVRVVRGTRDGADGADGASKKSAFYLLVKRPEGGLLSGLWEFPSVVMEETDADEDALRAAADRLLAETLRFPAAASSSFSFSFSSREADASPNPKPKPKPKPKPLGEIVHVFSHVRQTMKVELVSVELSPTDDGFFGDNNARSGDVSSATPEWKWVAEDDMTDAGLTSGVRKVYDLVVGKKNGKRGTSKAKQAPVVKPGESAIARMFAKKAKTETVAE
jgi:A/G-specific adenine glycosylase